MNEDHVGLGCVPSDMPTMDSNHQGCPLNSLPSGPDTSLIC